MEFTTELLATGGTTTGFVVPDAVVEALGGGRRPKVVVTVDGHTWRTSIASMGGRFLLGASAAVREASGISAGQTYTVDVEVDTAPRTVDVPDDLAAALAASPAAAGRAGPALTYSQQRQHAEAVLAAKKPETRERRVATASLGRPAPRPDDDDRGRARRHHDPARRRDRQRRQLRAARRGWRRRGDPRGRRARRCSRSAASCARTTHPAGLDVGDAVATGAGDLPCRWVVHTVGPNRHRGQTDPALLASCFARSLDVARGLGARSVAFPAVSAGVYGWDADEVADVAVAHGAVRVARRTTGIDLVRFVLFGDRVARRRSTAALASTAPAEHASAPRTTRVTGRRGAVRCGVAQNRP